MVARLCTSCAPLAAGAPVVELVETTGSSGSSVELVETTGSSGSSVELVETTGSSVAIGQPFDEPAVPVDAREERIDAEVLAVGVDRLLLGLGHPERREQGGA